MNSLSRIQEKVQSRVANMQSQIVFQVFQLMLNKHNDLNCECDHCSKLREYVKAKKHKCYIGRQLRFDMWEIYGQNAEFEDIISSRIDIIKERIRLLKSERNSLKLLKV